MKTSVFAAIAALAMSSSLAAHAAVPVPAATPAAPVAKGHPAGKTKEAHHPSHKHKHHARATNSFGDGDKHTGHVHKAHSSAKRADVRHEAETAVKAGKLVSGER